MSFTASSSGDACCEMRQVTQMLKAVGASVRFVQPEVRLTSPWIGILAFTV
jgi:hypothetical protein